MRAVISLCPLGVLGHALFGLLIVLCHCKKGHIVLSHVLNRQWQQKQNPQLSQLFASAYFELVTSIKHVFASLSEVTIL